jgi:hypothetical protein
MHTPDSNGTPVPHAHTEGSTSHKNLAHGSENVNSGEELSQNAAEVRETVERICGTDVSRSAHYLMILCVVLLKEKSSSVSSWQELLVTLATDLGVSGLTKEYLVSQGITQPDDLDILMVDGMGDKHILDLKNKAMDKVTKDQSLSELATVLFSH